MLSRALMIATVTLLIGCLTAVGVRAQENLERGKSPSQIFSGTCNACHKSPRGLLKNVPASSLPGFLRQHYTTGSQMASLLASFLISNGAADPRYQAKDQPKQKDAKQDGRPDQLDRFGRRQQPAAPATEASRPESEGAKPQRARAGGPAAMPNGWQGRAQRPTLIAPRMARPRCRPRPTANKAPSKSSASAPSPPPKSRRKPRRLPGAKPAKDDPSGDAAKTDAAKTDAAKTEGGTETAKTDAAKTRRCQDRRCQATFRPTPPRPKVTSLTLPSRRATHQARRRGNQARRRGEIRDRQG